VIPRDRIKYYDIRNRCRTLKISTCCLPHEERRRIISCASGSVVIRLSCYLIRSFGITNQVSRHTILEPHFKIRTSCLPIGNGCRSISCASGSVVLRLSCYLIRSLGITNQESRHTISERYFKIRTSCLPIGNGCRTISCVSGSVVLLVSCYVIRSLGITNQESRHTISVPHFKD